MKVLLPRVIFITTLVVIFSVAAGIAPTTAQAGHLKADGVTEGFASQIIAWYDETQSNNVFSLFQVTNASNDTAVTVHIQVFADDADSEDRCREHDFTDTLTPNDTIVYVLGSLNEPFDGCPTCTRGGNNNHVPVPIDLDGTRGFIVATSVNQPTLPRRAISHNYLYGSMNVYIENPYDPVGFNAMGREAIDLATGALLPQGTLLDGVVNGLRLLQPTQLRQAFNYINIEDESSVISIAFTDTYADVNGEYRAVPATAVWDALMYDQFEQATSCQQHVNTCYVSLGLNDDLDNFAPPFVSMGDNDFRLCPSVSFDDSQDTAGWFRIEVSGLGGNINNLGLFAVEDPGALFGMGSWMVSE